MSLVDVLPHDCSLSIGHTNYGAWFAIVRCNFLFSYHWVHPRVGPVCSPRSWATLMQCLSVPITLASRLPRARVSNFQRYDLLIGLCGPGVVGFPLQNRLMEMESTLWIEEVWIPKLQQEGDASIMEQIAALPGITKGQLDKFNKVQLFLRVIIFVELLNLNGKYIPDIMLIGDWQAGSDWEWMRQLHP